MVDPDSADLSEGCAGRTVILEKRLHHNFALFILFALYIADRSSSQVLFRPQRYSFRFLDHLAEVVAHLAVLIEASEGREHDEPQHYERETEGVPLLV